MTAVPLVSIFLVTYNAERFIASTLETCIAQTYRPLQIVVSDDGSQDSTPKIIEEYAARYPDLFTILTRAEHLGVTGNANRALRMCNGRYIAFMGGDDLALPARVEKQVAYMRAHPGCSVCSCDVEVFNDRTGETYVLRCPEFARSRDPVRLISQRNQQPACSFMIDRELAADVAYDPRTPVVSDWLLFTEIALRGTLGYVPEVLVRYRRHGNNVTSAGIYLHDRLVAMDILLAEHPQYALATKIGRSWRFHEQAKRDYLAERLDSARRFAAAAILEWPLHPENYALLMLAMAGKRTRAFVNRHINLVRRIVSVRPQYSAELHSERQGGDRTHAQRDAAGAE